MITTRRSGSESGSTVLERSSAGGVGVLERKSSAILDELTVNNDSVETVEQARVRMRGNLDMLLNYDRFSEQTAVVDDVAEIVDEVMSEQVVAMESVDLQDEDIRPTSTTMQFGDGDIDQIYNEMHREQQQEEKTSYRLNAKGKLVVVLYSLAVAVILALIIINTGVLARLSGTREAKIVELNGKVSQYEQLSSEIDRVSQNDYVIEKAEELGMVKK